MQVVFQCSAQEVDNSVVPSNPARSSRSAENELSP